MRIIKQFHRVPYILLVWFLIHCWEQYFAYREFNLPIACAVFTILVGFSVYKFSIGKFIEKKLGKHIDKLDRRYIVGDDAIYYTGIHAKIISLGPLFVITVISYIIIQSLANCISILSFISIVSKEVVLLPGQVHEVIGLIQQTLRK